MPRGKFRVANVYGAGAAMGFSPQQVEAMSIWQFNAAIAGFIRSRQADDKRLSEAEKVDLFDWIEAIPATARKFSTQTYDWDGLRLVPAGRITFER